MAKKYSKLTAENIRKLLFGECITEHGITAHRAREGIHYEVNVMVDGQRIHRRLGPVLKSEAEKFIEEKKSAARNDKLDLPRARKTKIGFSLAADRYIELLKETDGKNISEKERMLRRHLKPYFKHTKLDKINKTEQKRYRAHRKTQGAANGSINHEQKTLGHLFTIALEEEWIVKRPAMIEKLNEGDGRIIALDDDESVALIKAAIGDQDSDCWLFVVYALNTGMRHREILRSRFDEIDWARRRQHIDKAKAGARVQPLTVELVEALKKVRAMRDDDTGWIFPTKRSDSKKPYRDRMTQPFRRAVVRAGLDPEKITPHVCRHTIITRLTECGVPLTTVAAISGHKNVATLKRYTHLSDSHIDNAMTEIGRAAESDPDKGALIDLNTKRKAKR